VRPAGRIARSFNVHHATISRLDRGQLEIVALTWVPALREGSDTPETSRPNPRIAASFAAGNVKNRQEIVVLPG
jgi:hypothetical protein